MTKLNYLISLLLLVVVQSCGTPKPTFKGAPLAKHTTLEGTGFTQERLDSLSKHLENKLETTGMLIVKDGKVIYEYGDIKDVGYIASCRKSVLSILYGKYVEAGTIDLNQTVKPGEYFVYNNWDFNVAGYILEEKSGKSVYQEIEEQLAIPLGFQDWNIKNQKRKVAKKKSRYSAYHMYISARDLAKIGQLMLNKGKWNGKQIISEKWIEKITSTVTPVQTLNERNGLNESSPLQFSYGYMWWLVDNFKKHPDFEGAYSASGWGGQFITIIPKLNIVVVHKYKVPTLVNWGLKRGGVSDYTYWTLLYDFVKSEQ